MPDPTSQDGDAGVRGTQAAIKQSDVYSKHSGLKISYALCSPRASWQRWHFAAADRSSQRGTHLLQHLSAQLLVCEVCLPCRAHRCRNYQQITAGSACMHATQQQQIIDLNVVECLLVHCNMQKQ
jgi:hypothetical protein